MWNTYTNAKSNLNPLSIKGTQRNAPIARDTVTQKTTATSNHGASNVPAVTLQTSATEKKDQMKFDVSSVAEITQRTTKDAPSTNIFKRKYTLLSDPRLTSHPWNHTLPLRKTINRYTHNQE
jgi:hypothetical protein